MPSDQNGAEELVPVLTRLNAEHGRLSQDDKAVINGKSDHWSKTEATPAQTTRVLAILEPTLVELKQNAHKPLFIPKKDWSRPEMVLLPEYADIRTATKTLAFSARHHARIGNVDRAVEDLTVLNRMASYAGYAPILIGYLVETACRAIGIAAVQSCIQADPSNALEYSSVLDENDLPLVGRALRGETYFAMGIVRNLTVIDLFQGSDSYYWDLDDESRPVGRTAGLPTDPIVRAMTGRMLSYHLKVLKTLGRDNREKQPGQLQAEMLKLETELIGGPADHLAEELMPIYSQSVVAQERQRATLRTVQALAKVVNFHQEQRRWPTSLAETGVTTEDPFNPDKSLQYRRTNDEIRIWSFGPDRVDQRGVTQSEASAKGSYQSHDLVAVFRLTR